MLFDWRELENAQKDTIINVNAIDEPEINATRENIYISSFSSESRIGEDPHGLIK